jgi:hypothetical protein
MLEQWTLLPLSFLDNGSIAESTDILYSYPPVFTDIYEIKITPRKRRVALTGAQMAAQFSAICQTDFYIYFFVYIFSLMELQSQHYCDATLEFF